jgi:hypothetical protein
MPRRRKNPLLPLPPDYFPKAAFVRDGLKKIRQDLYEKTGQWLTLAEVQELLDRNGVAQRRKQMRVIPGGKRRANPARPAGEVVRVKVVLRRKYDHGTDILGDIDSRYHSEIKQVFAEVDKKVPKNVPDFEVVRVEAVAAKEDPYDFAWNIEYTLDVTVKYDWEE